VKQLLLVYNADTNLSARIGDFLTKILRPDKYACRLCMLTFGWLAMFPEWKRYLSERAETVVELHRDEFRRLHGDDWPLPAVFLLSGGELSPVLSADEINGIGTLEELMERLDEKLR